VSDRVPDDELARYEQSGHERARRAEERAQAALRRAEEAREEAARATDDEGRARHEREARTHERAAEAHRRAQALQEDHAEHARRAAYRRPEPPERRDA
jgi:hypothetical protein